MIELIAGFVVGVVVALRQGWAGDAAVLAGGLVGVGAYLASCAVWPHRPCPLRWRKSHQPRADGPGKAYRRRRPCRLCGFGDYVRVGARLIGRG